MIKSVLLVEDNEDDVELTLRSFHENKLTGNIVVSRNGQEALDYLFFKGRHAERESTELPVLILLDLKLPKVDGFEVLNKIRSHPSTKCIPVVVLTTSSQAKDKRRSY